MIHFNRNADALDQEQRCRNGDLPCLICGRPIKAKQFRRAHAVRVGHGGGWICTNAEADANPAGDLGLQLIGSRCWKRHPKFHPYEDGGK